MGQEDKHTHATSHKLPSNFQKYVRVAENNEHAYTNTHTLTHPRKVSYKEFRITHTRELEPITPS